MLGQVLVIVSYFDLNSSPVINGLFIIKKKYVLLSWKLPKMTSNERYRLVKDDINKYINLLIP